MPHVLRPLGHLAVVTALCAGVLVAVGGSLPASAADPADRALSRLHQDSDGALTVRGGDAGSLTFVGVPARSDVDNPAVTRSTRPGAAADAAIQRYGAALGMTRTGTVLDRTSVRASVAGDVVRYQQAVDGVPVLGGEVVVSLRDDGELSSVLANTSEQTSVGSAVVSEHDAEAQARAAFRRSAGPGAEVILQSHGRWLLDAALIGGDLRVHARTVWRFEITRDADERRQILIDDRTGAVLMNVDEIQHAADRVVCDNNNVRRTSEVPCTSGFARIEGGATTGQADVDTAYDVTGAVSDFYQQVGGIDLAQLLGVTVGGVKRLASTVRWCFTDASDGCPYDNAFWNGSQMYYGQGYAAADDVVGHEMTHGFTEHSSGLLYWGQSGAIDESISDIIGEIVDHRRGADSDSAWSVGEDIPGFPSGFRNMQDPTLFGDPDKTSSASYVKEGADYPDSDGVHANSGVGNKTAYLISQGGAFNGQTIAGIDAGDPGLTNSARLWLLVDQSLTSGSDYADEAAVLDQACQTLLAAGSAGFTAADCAAVHAATLATQLRETPLANPQPADATAECPAGTFKQVLLDSETGVPTSKFTAGPTWGRGPDVSHTGPDAWLSGDPDSVGTSSLVASNPITLPGGQKSYLHFQQWRVLDYDSHGFYDAGTVEIDRATDSAGPVDAAGLPWVNGPTETIFAGSGNPAAGRKAFGGDSRGYVASRVDLSSYAGAIIRPQFTMNTDDYVAYPGWAVDDITVYTCEPAIAVVSPPSVIGSLRVGGTVTALPGSWFPLTDVYTYQWLRNGRAIPGATAATFKLGVIDHRKFMQVRVTASRPLAPSSATSISPVGPQVGGLRMTAGKVVLKGTARVGSTLKVNPGSWRSGVHLRFYWMRDRARIPRTGVSKRAYRLTAADKGHRIQVLVLGDKTGYDVRSAKSNRTAKVKAKKPPTRRR